MIEKIEKFHKMYFPNQEIVFGKNMSFAFRSNNGSKTSYMEIINFINEDEFIKKLENLFLLKVKRHKNENLYFFYITYKSNNLLINVSIDGAYKIQPLNEIKDIDVLTGVHPIAKKLIEHLIKNTNERLIFLLNKKD